MYVCSLSCKTINTRENFWNVNCFATDKMQDETAKDNKQTAAGISHDLIQNNEFDLKVSANCKNCANCENLQWYRFASWEKVSQLQKNTDRKPPITAN